jgi:CRISPR-associated protein Cas1
MSTIYLTKHGTVVSKDGGKICIKTQEGNMKHIPSSYSTCLVVMAHTQISHAAIIEILSSGGSIIYLDSQGELLGELGRSNINKRHLIRQMVVFVNNDKKIELARYFAYEKIMAQRSILRLKNKELRNMGLEKVAEKLYCLAKNVHHQLTINKIMGIEGLASKEYFEVFNLLYSDTCFEWNGRNRRPPLDPINSMLSFGYCLLEKDVRRALSVRGLETSIGYLHSLDLRKDTLVFDVMEKFRPLIVDRFVMRCASWKMFHKEDFIISESSCLFTDKARNKYITEYEKFVGEYDENLEKTLRGKIDEEVRKVDEMIKKLVDEEDLEI